jgi:hypothetical protein
VAASVAAVAMKHTLGLEKKPETTPKYSKILPISNSKYSLCSVFFRIFRSPIYFLLHIRRPLQNSGPGKRNSVALSVGSADRQTICETISADVEPFVVGLHA